LTFNFKKQSSVTLMRNINRHLIQNLKNNHLIKGSLIILIGSLTTGFGNYLFNIFMGRMLGPVDYGILASLLSLTYIIGVPSQTINFVVSKYVAEMQGAKQWGKIAVFLKQIFKKVFILGIFAIILFFSLIFFLKNFLHLPSYFPLIILGIILFLSFIYPTATGGLLGLEKFTDLTINNILMIITKLGLGILLVYLGWKVQGALLAIVISSLLVISHAFYQLKLPKEQAVLNINVEKLLAYSKGVFWTSLCLTALFNLDVILVKHFLSPTDAGYYAVLSLLGKIIFFITASVSTVLFPLSAKNHSQGKEDGSLLKLALFVVFLVSLTITLLYFSFPTFLISILFGASYLPATAYVGWIGIIFTFYSLINILVIYNLSIGRFNFLYFLILGIALQIGLLSFFHANLWQIIYVMIGVMGGIWGGLVVFGNKKTSKNKTKLF